MNTERLAVIQALSLKHGEHQQRLDQSEAEMCVMEAVAYVAGELWSDHPRCACPVLGAFLRDWNDSLPNDMERDRLLKPLVPRLVGSKATRAVESRRAWMALDWLARVQAPAWLELAGLTEHAALCRSMADFTNAASCKAGHQILAAARAAAGDAAGAAAGAAAWAAARAAAGAAAWAAARAAAGAAARDAAWAAAGDAAGDAAWAAARAAWDAAQAASWAAAAAGAAAGAAARSQLAPTVAALQLSALQLIDRMLLVGEP